MLKAPTTTETPSFDLIDEALRRAEASTDAAEAHGSLCGLVCGLGDGGQSAWLAETLADAQANEAVAEQTSAVLEALAASTRAALEGADMTFQPLLPDDAEPLVERVDGLAQWCQGFNHGLFVAARIGDAEAELGSGNTAEIVRDFGEMAQVVGGRRGGRRGGRGGLRGARRVRSRERAAGLRGAHRGPAARPVCWQALKPSMNTDEFLRRRRQLMRMMGKGAVAILPAAQTRLRNRDVLYPYRQDSDFYYLTGFAEPDAVAVLAPGRPEGEYLLFCRERDPEKETWDGTRAGPGNAVTQFGADAAYPDRRRRGAAARRSWGPATACTTPWARTRSSSSA